MQQGTFKAFVSSTYEDLKEHRAYAIGRLRNGGFFVDPMEDWTADSGEPSRFSQERIDGCDLCVLLVAMRRGHVPAGEKRSITQLEYARACELGIDVLPFLLKERTAWLREFDERDSDPALHQWRTELEKTRGVAYFDTAPHSVNVDSAVIRWVTKQAVLYASLMQQSSTSRLPGLGAKPFVIEMGKAVERLQAAEFRITGLGVR